MSAKAGKAGRGGPRFAMLLSGSRFLHLEVIWFGFAGVHGE